MKKKLAAWIALGIITVIAGLFLSLTNEVTKDVIADQDAQAKIQARKDVLPDADAFEPLDIGDIAPLTDLYVGTKDGEPQGYVGTIHVKGYGGPVQVIAGLDAQGKVTGVSVGGSDFAETAGLGAKAKDLAFAQQFVGKQSPIKAVKNPADRGDSTIDAITAATITTNAVAGGVNAIASKVDNYLNPQEDVVAEGTTYGASTDGYAGPVAVLVTVKDDGTISGLRVGDEQFNETEGYGAAALDAAFTRQFAGKTLPLQLSDIDAISGATITSQAVVDAVNQAYETKNVVAAPAAEGTAYTASEKGFAGPVAVFFTATDDGTITSMKVGDEAFAETEGFGAGALEPSYAKQFVGKTLPLDPADVDGISGATITSDAVVAALNRAFAEQLIDESAAVSATEEVSVTEQPAPAQTGEEVQQTNPEAVQQGLQSLHTRTSFGEAQGFAGPVQVLLGVGEDNTITALTVIMDEFAETTGIGDQVPVVTHLEQFVGKSLPLAEGDADMVSGATVTSQALVDAINAAYNRLADGVPAEDSVPAATDGQSSEASTPAAATAFARVAGEGNALRTRTAVGTAEGFQGTVQVVLGTEENIIVSLQVLEDGFAETPGIGDAVAGSAHLQQLLGKPLPLAADSDIIAGATVSSKALIEAINHAYAQLSNETQPESDTVSNEQGADLDGVATRSAVGAAQGFGGEVTVALTLNSNGDIVSVVVMESGFAETPGIGDQVLDASYLEKFAGLTPPLKQGDVDAIGGATVTSDAILEAVNDAAERLSK